MHPQLDALTLLCSLELAAGFPADDYTHGFAYAITTEDFTVYRSTALYAMGVRDAHMLECERWDELAA